MACIKACFIVAVLALLALGALFEPSIARDHGQFGNVNPEIHDWFEHLKSGKGLCCSFADGVAIPDVDWEARDGHYRVRVEGRWYDVDDDAVITEPNKVGRTMVWPYYSGGEIIYIRCFMPGSMT
jgi:hypothetical protein